MKVSLPAPWFVVGDCGSGAWTELTKGLTRAGAVTVRTAVAVVVAEVRKQEQALLIRAAALVVPVGLHPGVRYLGSVAARSRFLFWNPWFNATVTVAGVMVTTKSVGPTVVVVTSEIVIVTWAGVVVVTVEEVTVTVPGEELM